jgi:hypothetical protein
MNMITLKILSQLGLMKQTQLYCKLHLYSMRIHTHTLSLHTHSASSNLSHPFPEALYINLEILIPGSRLVI